MKRSLQSNFYLTLSILHHIYMYAMAAFAQRPHDVYMSHGAVPGKPAKNLKNVSLTKKNFMELHIQQN